jgi:hypothetical protein
MCQQKSQMKKKTLVENISLESKSKNQKIKNEIILKGFN